MWQKIDPSTLRISSNFDLFLLQPCEIDSLESLIFTELLLNSFSKLNTFWFYDELLIISQIMGWLYKPQVKVIQKVSDLMLNILLPLVMEKLFSLLWYDLFLEKLLSRCLIETSQSSKSCLKTSSNHQSFVSSWHEVSDMKDGR